MAPCHHGIAHRRVADGGDGFQIWKAAVYWISSRREPTTGVLQLGAWEGN